MSEAGKEAKGESAVVAGSEKGVYEDPKTGCLHGTIASIGVSGFATGLLYPKNAGRAEAGSVSHTQQPGDGDGAGPLICT